MRGFYVYAIAFDQDTFGVFATRADAEESLQEQIAGGGPAWDDCKIERWFIDGEPERGDRNQETGPSSAGTDQPASARATHMPSDAAGSAVPNTDTERAE